ncbi:MAG: response regulator [Gammaproteobacteria bacterium]
MNRLLIIDDDQDFRNLLKTYLSKSFSELDVIDYDPISEGIPGSEFPWPEFQVLILDYDLQNREVNGLDILACNKNNGLFPVTVMLTGEGSEDIADSALKLGVADYLRKDKVDVEQLEAAVREALQIYTKRQERLYSMEEVRKLAQQQASKIILAYKNKYDQIRQEEQKRLQEEHQRLEAELKKHQEVLASIKASRQEVEQNNEFSNTELQRLAVQQKEAEEAVNKANWKINQGETLEKIQLDEDLAEFEQELKRQQSLTTDLQAHLEHLDKIKRETAVARKKNTNAMLDEVREQLGPDKNE